MATYLSPGVFWREQDVSVYTPQLSSTAVGMVGLASKGPINEPTFISDGSQFSTIFGDPVTTVDAYGIPTTESYGPYAAMSYLSEGRQLWYTRVSDVDTLGNYTAEKANLTAFENATAVSLLGLFSGNLTVGTGANVITFTFDGGVATTNITIPVSGSSQVYTIPQLVSILNNDAVFAVWASASVNVDPATPAKNGVIKVTGKLLGSAHTIVVSGTAMGTLFTSGSSASITTAGTGVVFAPPKLFTSSVLSAAIKTIPSPTGNDLKLNYTYKASPIVGQEIVVDHTNDTATLSDGRSFPSKILNQKILFDTDPPEVSRTVTAISSDLKQITLNETPATGSYAFTYEYTVAITLLTDGAASLTFATMADFATFLNNLVTSDKRYSFRDHFVAEGIDTASTEQVVIYPIDHAGASTAFTVLTPDDSSLLDYGREIYGTAGTTLVAQLAGTSPTALLSVEALSAGTWGNDISVGFENINSVNRTFDLLVYYKGNVVERYTNLVRTPSNLGVDSKGQFVPNPKYVETAVAGSSFITVTDLQKDVNIYYGTLPKASTRGGSTSLSGGSNGAPASFNVAPYIGTLSGNVATGLQNYRNPESYDINILCVPGISDASVINEMIDICTTRADCMALVDPPLGLTPRQVVDWHNGVGEYNDHAAFASSYAALYYPWLQIFDPISSAKIWTPPSGHMAKVYAYSDRTTELWFAPAGLSRGHLTVPAKAEYLPSKGELDLLYGDGNAVNPIATFKTDGINVWGQRTLQRTPTALDRVNVRRTLLYLEKVLATAARQFVFQPNDPTTWVAFRRLVTPLLEGVKTRRGLTDFKVVCDATVNTPDVVEQNMMKAYIFVKPTKTVEFIQLNFVITSQVSSFTEQVY